MSAVVTAVVGVEVVLTAIGLLVFAISYGTFFNWNKTSAGRSLMYFVLSLLSLVFVSIFRLLLGNEHEVTLILRAVVFTIMTITTWRLVHVLWGSHRDVLNRSYKPERITTFTKE